MLLFYCYKLSCLSGGAGTEVTDHSKIGELKKFIQNLPTGKAESMHNMKELEGHIKELNQKLASAEERNNILLKEQELVKVEKSQITQEYERLNSEFSKLQNSVAEQETILKEQGGKFQPMSSPVEEEVLRLQQALLGMKKLNYSKDYI